MRRRYQHQTISQRIFGSLPAAAETIFSTDSYVDRLHSPKSAERDRRGCDEKFIELSTGKPSSQMMNTRNRLYIFFSRTRALLV